MKPFFILVPVILEHITSGDILIGYFWILLTTNIWIFLITSSLDIFGRILNPSGDTGSLCTLCPSDRRLHKVLFGFFTFRTLQPHCDLCFVACSVHDHCLDLSHDHILLGEQKPQEAGNEEAIANRSGPAKSIHLSGMNASCLLTGALTICFARISAGWMTFQAEPPTQMASSQRSCGKSGRKANSFNAVPETLQAEQMHRNNLS